MPTTKKSLVLLVFILSCALGGFSFAFQEDKTDPNMIYDTALYGAMKYRMIGPYRGGRVTAVCGVRGQPFTFYFGATGGGVWKTTNAGERWNNVSDGFFEVGSIGAIAVAESDPNVVYVGTGSACPRGNISVGNGVYKSTDAGRSWTHIGLKEAGQIGRIRVHPQNPDLVYLAALGHIFGPNEERGVFRSQDGGRNWEKVLYVSEKTGAIDIAMNPANSREIYAAMWRVERKPWTLIDGDEEGGVHKTTDAGDNWEKLENGLPTGVLIGRIGLAIARTKPDRVWAQVSSKEKEDGGLYRTDDAGKKWTRINPDRRLQGRGWYYSHVEADPTDENTIWAMNAGYYKSIDGGKSFERVAVPHGDNHDLWINPDNPKIMIQANDGGANVTLDRAETWSTQYNQPTAEFYRVTVDNRFPYRVYGAQQDNSTISVPSWSSGGVTPKQYWHDVAGGESGHIAVNPENPDLTYAGNYIGLIDRYDRKTDHARNVIIYPELADGVPVKDLKYRFQWNAVILISPHDPNVVYHTSNYVHRTTDGGMSWETVSPDLTKDEEEKQAIPGGPIQHDDTGVEVYNTVFALAESPHTAGELWAGTDDGLVHISRDDGKTWMDITPKAMPEDGTVNTIELSAHQPGRALVAVYRYRMDDFTPYVFRTNNYGESWDLLTDGKNGIPADHPVRVIREDPERRGLLYAGTEFSMFISFDDGEHWQSLQLNLPHVPITDLAVHRQDLVVATQGRSFWILDDLTPLHQISSEAASARAFLYKPRNAYRIDGGRFRGDRAPEPKPRGAVIHYYFKEKPEDEVKLEILDGTDRVIRTFTGKADEEETKEAEDNGIREPSIPVKEGMNRFVWDLMHPRLDLVKGSVMSLGYTGGYWVVPGTYKVRMTAGDWSETPTFDVLKDPRLTEVTERDLIAQYELMTQVREKIHTIHDAVRSIRSVRDQMTTIIKLAKKAGIEGDFQETVDAIDEKLTGVEEELIQTKSEAGQDPLNFPPRIDNHYVYLYGHLNGDYGRPTAGSYQRFEDLNAELQPHMDKLEAILATDVAQFNRTLNEKGAAVIMVPKP
jgi:photosystem II stability/assembly factor-like uncharacterized protein